MPILVFAFVSPLLFGAYGLIASGAFVIGGAALCAAGGFFYLSTL